MHKKGLISSVATGLGSQADTAKDATGISINNKDGLAGTIEYYGIGGLLANTMDGKQLPAEVINIIGKQPIKVILIAVPQPVSQGLKLQRFGVIIKTGVDKGGEFREGEAAQGLWRQRPGGFQTGDSLFHIAPGSCLGKDGTDYHLKRLLGRPPVLWSIAVHKPVVDIL